MFILAIFGKIIIYTYKMCLSPIYIYMCVLDLSKFRKYIKYYAFCYICVYKIKETRAHNHVILHINIV